MATRGRPAYQIPALPEEDEGALREVVKEALRQTVEHDGKFAYRYHPLQLVVLLQRECYALMEEWRQRGSEDWQRFFRQAGDRLGQILPERAKDPDRVFLLPSEIWTSEDEKVFNETKIEVKDETRKISKTSLER